MTTLLLEFGIRTALIAAGTATVLWILRIKSASVRHAAWSAVVVTMLVLPLWLASGVHVSLPVLTPAPTNTGVATDSVSVAPPAPATPSTVDALADSQPAFTPAAPSPPATIDWRAFFIGAYLTGAIMLLVRLIVGTVQANGLRRSAVPSGGRLTSDRCTTPITVGWFAPALILPRGWDQWSPEQLDVVLTHEQEHARRHDPLIQWLALFNRAVFWFHPLAWWLERRLATLAEEACDAAVLSAGHSPQAYSEYLLDMARTVARQHGRVRLIGMAMPGTGLSSRLRQILQGLPNVRVSRTRLVCTIAFCAISSVMFAAGTLAERALQQNVNASAIKFDVVSIKPCPDLPPPGSGRSTPGWAIQISPGYVHWDCVTLSELIDQAYTDTNNKLLNVVRVTHPGSQQRVRGGPSWATSDKFTIEIKMSGDITPATPDGTPQRYAATREAMLPALRALLEDRFQLKLRKATEDKPMYMLTVARGGLKITRTGPSRCFERPPTLPRGQVAVPPPGFEGTKQCGFKAGSRYQERQGRTKIVDLQDVTLGDFAHLFLSNQMDRYVLDKTSVEGRFTFTLEYAPDDSTPADLAPSGYLAALGRPEPARQDVKADGPNIFKALEALGLKLEPTRAPAEYFRIESAQRPTPNEAVQTAPASAPSAPGMQIKYEAVSIHPCDTSAQQGTGRGGGGNSPRFAITPGYVTWGCVSLAQLIDNAWGGAPPNNALLNTLPGRPGDDGPKRVRGGPSWVEDEKFAIEIRITGDTTDLTGSARHTLVNNAMGPALRSMLEDRFKLKVRKMTEERPMYALSVSPGGHKLKPHAPEDCAVWKEGMVPRPSRTGLLDGKWICGILNESMPLAKQERLKAGEDRAIVLAGMVGQRPGGASQRAQTTGVVSPPGSEIAGPNRRMEGYGLTLAGFARSLAGLMDRFVIDKSGIGGAFTFAFEFTANDNTPNAGWGMIGGQPDWPAGNSVPAAVGKNQTIFKSLEALGLRLEPTKGPAEYLVIESAQRPIPGPPSLGGER
jgi:uncharacterized protein (TIGR03435 family)